jgi:hypothetical protein
MRWLALRLSRWLQGARFEGGLLIPGHPSRHACDIRLAVEGAHIVADDLDALLLYEHVDRLRTQETDRWRVTSWVAGGNGGIGVAVTGGGRYAPELHALGQRRRTARNRFNKWGDAWPYAPLAPRNSVAPATDTDRALLDVLCRALAMRPSWRTQLADQGRISQLLDDLATHDRKVRHTNMGARRQTTEVRLAMRALHYEHELDGRPLPGLVYAPETEMIDAVLARVHASPYALPTSETMVRAVLLEHYLDIPPWPFQALAAG